MNNRRRASSRGIRTAIERLTLGFVILLLVWTFVMLVLYEWPTIHSHARLW